MGQNFKVVYHPMRGTWIVMPSIPAMQGRYLIECLREKEAVELAKAFVRGELTPPLENESDFENSGLFAENKLPIFRPRTPTLKKLFKD